MATDSRSTRTEMGRHLMQHIGCKHHQLAFLRLNADRVAGIVQDQVTGIFGYADVIHRREQFIVLIMMMQRRAVPCIHGIEPESNL